MLIDPLFQESDLQFKRDRVSLVSPTSSILCLIVQETNQRPVFFLCNNDLDDVVIQQFWAC